MEEEKRNRGRQEILRYVRRLVRCNNNDVVKLALLEPEDWMDVDRLDLTGVAELRRNANGTFEVKFIDRMKVLSMLRDLLEEKDEGALEEFFAELERTEDGEVT